MLRVAGQVAIANNDAKRATDYFERAAAVAKDDPAAWIRLGAVRLATGDSEGAMRDLEAAAELDNDAYLADVGLVVAHVSRKEIDKALAAVDRLAKKQPKSGMPENLRGLVYLAKGDRKSARAAFEKALDLQPDFLPAATSLARLDIAEKQPEAARKRFEAIVAKAPKNDQALLALAEIQAATGMPLKEIVPTVDRAVNANPTSVEARLAQIGIHLRTNNPKAALAAAQSAAAALPDNPSIVESLGRAQLAAGEPNQAVASFNKLASLFPQSPGPLMLVARAHVAKKDFTAATPDLAEGTRAAARQPRRLPRRRSRPTSPRQARGGAGGCPGCAEGSAEGGDRLRVRGRSAHRREEVRRSRSCLRGSTQAAAGAAARAASARTAGGGRKRNEGDAVVARWLREHPKDPVVRLYLADRDMQAKDYKAAAAVTADRRRPAEQRVAMSNLAWTIGQLNDPSALGFAEKAARLAPRNPAVADTYGLALGRERRHEAWHRDSGTCGEGSPERARHQASLRQGAAAKSGEKDAARKELEQIAQTAGRSGQGRGRATAEAAVTGNSTDSPRTAGA